MKRDVKLISECTHSTLSTYMGEADAAGGKVSDKPSVPHSSERGLETIQEIDRLSD